MAPCLWNSHAPAGAGSLLGDMAKMYLELLAIATLGFLLASYRMQQALYK
jgi:hypothetical protein